MTYYHSTGGFVQLDLFRTINKRQDTRVLSFITEYNAPFSASVIWKIYNKEESATGVMKMLTPITSIRRSINTLKKTGHIRATGERVTGLYGRPELQYKLSLSQ